MCGLVGFLGAASTNEANLAVLRSMADSISHRGPDDAGYWSQAEQGIAFGHRRLAVVDLSAAGHQPMHAAHGRYVIVYNGEIYNHLALREELTAGRTCGAWRGHSDTETLLAGIEAWGIEDTLRRCIGMFAIAVWDRERAVLTLARDRLGEKPLYYGWQGEGEGAVLLFGSELKALRAHPAFCAEVNRDALRMLLRYGYIPAPYCIYEGIAKLEPGCLLEISLAVRAPRRWPYWSVDEVARAGIAEPFKGTDLQAVDALESLLLNAVRQQMEADVPLGAFLSGGVDSSLVVALMQAQSSRPVKTFSIGFREDGYDEAGHARAVARHLGTEHAELYVTAQDTIGVVRALGTMYDEPLADDSQIPTFLVSQMARQQVTVSLSGDGGDELFCGYNLYQLSARMWRQMSMFPTPLRKIVARGVSAISPAAWNRVGASVGLVWPGALNKGNVGDKLHKGAQIVTNTSAQALYHDLISHWHELDGVVIGGKAHITSHSGDSPRFAGFDTMQSMMLLDQLTYLPDDILAKVDRASMLVSLETRVPLLDHRVVEFAWRLPQSMKLRGGQTKWALRQVLYRHVPQALIERPKQGFSVPVAAWLRGPLRDWADALLDESRLAREGYFQPTAIRRKWMEHLSGHRNWHRQLWGVLMFQVWLEQQ
ncbi:asparagine synthase (glutamine-hydrolyzing) [Oxalobacteraceae bacterium GrIS 1.11]